MMLSRRGLLGGLPSVVAGAAGANFAPVQIRAAMTVRPAFAGFGYQLPAAAE